jgi:hypothetical protein
VRGEQERWCQGRSGQERWCQGEDVNGFRAGMRGLPEGIVICRALIFFQAALKSKFWALV